MNQHNVHLLDLPNEILFFILKKLDNIHVLYSLLGINNQRLHIIAQEQIFTNILNFVSISQSTDEIFSTILNRFCTSILPIIHKNVKSLIVDSISMECILRASNYPNLTELKLFNFNKAIVSQYFMDDSLFGHIFKQQITNLILIINENNIEIEKEAYTKNVYVVILAFFKNLKHLTIVESSSMDNYPRLSLCDLSPTTFFSSTLTKLCINVKNFDDVQALLDGRLKQLITLIVQVDSIHDRILTSYKWNDLPNLKCFSLTCYRSFQGFDNVIVRLLHRMIYLEELTLYLHIFGGSKFIAGTHLDNEILIHMPQLHTFIFYIASENVIADPTIRVSNDDIQRTFTNIEHRQVACMVDYFKPDTMICRIFSLPFKFHRLEHITNNIPNIIFNSVTYLKLWDTDPFKYKFFVRLARAFPFLKNLSIRNIVRPFLFDQNNHLRDKDWLSIIEYPHLISLDMERAHSYYVEDFLNETKAYLPHLTELKVLYYSLQIVTKYFTRNETRRNCARVRQLIVENPIAYPKDVYCYFPSLSV
ncbi:unnamed protein product [Rotaria sordida]|uniref:F-box domain-containing protein n=1 Tax=Rotaria sordida TaxID=392033 RepID=A0A814F987_9BILA|nr:unnamed protein product [Rotaria sordida]CAF3583018.1 unnamed protein product [Rotaria sordida]